MEELIMFKHCLVVCSHLAAPVVGEHNRSSHMRYLLKIAAAAIGSASVAGFASGAVAQEVTYTMTCQDVGAGTPEALGDREGHTLAIYSGSCRTDSGPLSGAITTGTDIFEWNGPNAVLVTGNGVARKPGATLVYQNTGGKLSLTMTDGKVTGWTASGKGTNLVATGTAASLAGKSYTWTAKPTGPGLSMFEVTQE
jgi:hypothetical protein